jgi:hypothetical protein
VISPCALSELGVVDPRTGVRHANDRYFALEGPPPDTPRRAAYNRDGGIAGMERYRALAELMRSDLVPSNELARHTADAGIRSKQELNSIHDIARRLQTPIRGPDSAEAVRSLDAIVDDTPASDLLTAAARNVDASSQMLTDPVSRAQILGLNWEDARVAANVVHAATDRDGSDGQGGTAAQAQAALDVIREVGGDRDGYLDRMADPVQDAVIGVGVGNFDALAASPVATSGVVGDPAARPDDPRAEPARTRAVGPSHPVSSSRRPKGITTCSSWPAPTGPTRSTHRRWCGHNP